MPSILLIEDEVGVSQVLVKLLSGEYAVTACGTLAEARSALTAKTFDLVLLDVKLPDGEGTKFYLEIRENENLAETPIIFLTGAAAPDDKVMAFALGADDYIVKPFETRELKARIKARISKFQARREKSDELVKGNLKIDLLSRKVFVQGGEEIELTPTTFKLLVYFAKHEDHVLSREQLMTAVWGSEVHLLDRTVDSHVSKLRKALEGSNYTVTPIHGVGYRFSRG
jgi:DNA-binding response OmpR family regulator